jgi:hypothetical protein
MALCGSIVGDVGTHSYHNQQHRPRLAEIDIPILLKQKQDSYSHKNCRARQVPGPTPGATAKPISNIYAHSLHSLRRAFVSDPESKSNQQKRPHSVQVNPAKVSQEKEHTQPH